MKLRQGVRKIEFLANPTVGQVRVGCAGSFMAGLVPATVELMATRYPGITVYADHALHATMEFRELSERSVDLVIGRVTEASAREDLEEEALYQEERIRG